MMSILRMTSTQNYGFLKSRKVTIKQRLAILSELCKGMRVALLSNSFALPRYLVYSPTIRATFEGLQAACVLHLLI